MEENKQKELWEHCKEAMKIKKGQYGLSEEEAEDLIQAAFIKCVSSEAKTKTYAYKTVSSVIIDYKRRTKELTNFYIKDDKETDVDDPLDGVDLIKALSEVLGEDELTALLLVSEEYTVKEAAEKMYLSQNKYKTILKEAREKAKELFGSHLSPLKDGKLNIKGIVD